MLFALSDDLVPEWTTLGDLGVPTFDHVYIDDDQTFTSTSPSDVVGLAVPLLSGHHYRVDVRCAVRSSLVTVGPVVLVTTPTTTTCALTARLAVAVAGVASEMQGPISSSGGAVVMTGVPASATDYLHEISGVVVPSADGTLQVRARISVGIGTITVRRGSHVLVTDLGA